VVLVEVGHVTRARADPHQVRGRPRSPQRHGRLAEEEIDVRRLVGLAGPALLGLLDEADDGGEALGKRGLVGEVCAGNRRREQGRERGEEREKRVAGVFDQNSENAGTRRTALAPKRTRNGRPSLP
jgi:hypothetical protein